MKRVLCLAGSLRRDSWNRRLLQSAAADAPDLELVVYEDLAAIPFFNEDGEDDCAPAVQQLRAVVAGADGLLIATPEYNHSFPAVLKNAIDWLSRSPGPMLEGKPVAVIGATTGGWGTRLAQSALRQVLTATGALVMPAPMLFVARAGESFGPDGNLVDSRVRESLKEVLSALRNWIELHRRVPGTDIIIDSLQEQDVGELLTVQRAAFLRDAQVYNDPFLPSLTQSQEEIRQQRLDPNRIFLAAKLNGRLVGSVRAVRNGRTAHIGRLMTAPDLEGRGIGRSLLKAIESRMMGDVDCFELGTGKKSTANIEMYGRHGYRVCAEAVNDSGVAEVTMRKPASAAC